MCIIYLLETQHGGTVEGVVRKGRSGGGACLVVAVVRWAGQLSEHVGVWACLHAFCSGAVKG